MGLLQNELRKGNKGNSVHDLLIIMGMFSSGKKEKEKWRFNKVRDNGK